MTLVCHTTEQAWADAKVADIARREGAGWHDHMQERAVGQTRFYGSGPRGNFFDHNLCTAPSQLCSAAATKGWSAQPPM